MPSAGFPILAFLASRTLGGCLGRCLTGMSTAALLCYGDIRRSGPDLVWPGRTRILSEILPRLSVADMWVPRLVDPPTMDSKLEMAAVGIPGHNSGRGGLQAGSKKPDLKTQVRARSDRRGVEIGREPEKARHDHG